MHGGTVSQAPKEDLGPIAKGIELACLVAAGVLIGFGVVRLSAVSECLAWWTPLVVVAAAVLVDFVSGVVHWIADTWGSESMPLLGSRFLRPFRLHHLDPDDLVRRGFIDCNGDIAMLTLPALLSVLWMPLNSDFGRVAAVLLLAGAVCALPTNQIHQWAHRRRPPKLVLWLQRCGLILSWDHHQIHHAAPFAANYCITTGWCNKTLTVIGFFPAMEWTITRLTGWQPRGDEGVFAAKYHGSAPISGVMERSA